MSTNNIYLDYSASTPVDPRVIEKMLPFLREHIANPSSQHRAGWNAMHAIDQARKQVMALLNASLPKEIIFTSGASESNSLAILGFILALRKINPNQTFHAITSQVEHKSVLETFEQLKEFNVDVDFIPVNSFGQVDVKTVEKHLRPNTVLMSFMWANNELGSLNPMAALSELAIKNKICLHTDATQACGKIPIDLQNIPIDFLSLSAHKMYGPKGVGALYRRFDQHHSKMNLSPLIRGGGQEYNVRAGTLNTPGIIGLGEAAKIAQDEFIPKDSLLLQEQTNNLKYQLEKLFPTLKLNGHPTERIPGHLHLSFPGIRWDQWLPRMSELCVSTTSACSSDSGQGSHVLRALGFSDNEIHSSLRISLGKFTTDEDLRKALLLFEKITRPQHPQAKP